MRIVLLTLCYAVLALSVSVSFAVSSNAQIKAAGHIEEERQMSPVYAFLKQGGDPNVRNERGGTFLETAVNWNKSDVVKSLLKMGADPNVCRPSNECALFISASRDTEILRLLIAAGANVNGPTGKSANVPFPLTRAAGNRPETFSRLRETGGYNGPSPNSLESVRILIAAGADVNHSEESGMTPLRQAMKNNNPSIAKLLLEAGADVKHRISDPTALLFGKTNRGKPILMETILMETIENYWQFKDISAVLLLLEHGANPNDNNDEPYGDFCEERPRCGDWQGHTVLTFAAERGYYDVVKLLLECGADPSIPRTNGSTAFQLAQKNKHIKTANLIKNFVTTRKKQSPNLTFERDCRETARVSPST